MKIVNKKMALISTALYWFPAVVIGLLSNVFIEIVYCIPATWLLLRVWKKKGWVIL